MKKFLLVFVIYGCSTPFDITEINQLHKIEFDQLYVKSDIELYDLRIDIIRQTERECINDSTTEIVDVPYHMVGFDLGNGLFYDLNHNLSLRIEKLLNFKSENNFILEKSYNTIKKRSKIFENINDTFKVKYPPKRKIYYKFSTDGYEDSLCIKYKGRLKYAIKNNDSILLYMNNKRIIDRIYTKGENHYYQKHRKRNHEYKLVSGEVILYYGYKIVLNPGKDVIRILKVGKRNDIELYKIIKSANELFIYNRRYYGKKIKLYDDKLIVFTNNKFNCEYRLLK